MSAVNSQSVTGKPDGNGNNNNNDGVAPAGPTLRCEGWIVENPVRSWSTSAMKYTSDVCIPPPGPGQVRVKMYAASVNPLDAKRPTFGRAAGGSPHASNDSAGGGEASTRHAPPVLPFPYVMGSDGAGVIESVGWNNDDVEQRERYGLQVGDRVAFMTDIRVANGGTFCQYALVDAETVAKIPPPTSDDVIDFVEAAAMPCALGTACVALFEKLQVSAGRSIFISGASGGVGSAAVQIAKYAGLCVLASCSTANVSYVKSLGADHVFDYTVSDVVGECLSHTEGFGVDYVLEVADASLALQHADALRFGGSICILPGHMPISAEVLFHRQVTVSYVCLVGLSHHPSTRGNLRQLVDTCLSLYQRGAFRLELETVPLGRADTAVDTVAGGHTRGKIVLTEFHRGEAPPVDNVVGTRRRGQTEKPAVHPSG